MDSFKLKRICPWMWESNPLLSNGIGIDFGKSGWIVCLLAHCDVNPPLKCKVTDTRPHPTPPTTHTHTPLASLFHFHLSHFAQFLSLNLSSMCVVSQHKKKTMLREKWSNFVAMMQLSVTSWPFLRHRETKGLPQQWWWWWRGGGGGNIKRDSWQDGKEGSEERTRKGYYIQGKCGWEWNVTTIKII